VNGELYTDFPYAVTLPTTEQRGLNLAKRGNAKIRIGNGGAWLRCDTVNGDITIHSR
jgi:hypothetical protein